MADSVTDVRQREVEDEHDDQRRQVDPGMRSRGGEHDFEQGKNRVQSVFADILPRDLWVGEGVVGEDGPEDDYER